MEFQIFENDEGCETKLKSNLVCTAYFCEQKNKYFNMSDTEENSDSIEDNTENFIENPTRELLAEGFLSFFTPVVENLDAKVKQTV